MRFYERPRRSLHCRAASASLARVVRNHSSSATSVSLATLQRTLRLGWRWTAMRRADLDEVDGAQDRGQRALVVDDLSPDDFLDTVRRTCARGWPGCARAAAINRDAIS